VRAHPLLRDPRRVVPRQQERLGRGVSATGAISRVNATGAIRSHVKATGVISPQVKATGAISPQVKAVGAIPPRQLGAIIARTRRRPRDPRPSAVGLEEAAGGEGGVVGRGAARRLGEVAEERVPPAPLRRARA